MSNDSEKQRLFTVAVVDTNGLLRGQKLAASAKAGILKNGMGMAPAQLALDPTDEILPIAGVTDDDSDFHDSVLKVDESTLCSMPFERPSDAALYLAEFTGDAAALCPRSLFRKQLERAASMGLTPKYGFEHEFTLFNETTETISEKGYDNLTTATPHASHDLSSISHCNLIFMPGLQTCVKLLIYHWPRCMKK